MKQGEAAGEPNVAASLLAQALAEFVVLLRWGALPESVRREALRSFVNGAGMMIAGS